MKLKKKKGVIDDILIPMITIVAIFILIMAFITSNKDIHKSSAIDGVVRQYILSMESTGYLDSSSQQQLIKDLQDVGMKNISLAGTTMSEVGYGKKINLVVNGTIEITKYDISSIFSVNTKTEDKAVKRIRSSTAKH